MLHILNGDATLSLLKQGPIKGRFLVWRDMLMEGPVSAVGKDKRAKGGKSAWSAWPAIARAGGIDWDARAAFLRDQYGIKPAKFLAGMKAFFTAYEKAAKGKDEVVFWFEEDFFCQIHLVYLLAHLPKSLRRKGRVSIICPEKPLGVRLPAAFPKLQAGRLPVEPALLTLSARVWKAYSLSSSQGWSAFLKWARSGKGFERWPLLKGGLRSHLGRLPAANGKPNAVAAAFLQALAAGPLGFPQFARKAWAAPMIRPLGLGDLQVARYALDLAAAAEPLLAIEGPGSAPAKGKPIMPAEWKLHLTAAGKAALSRLRVT